MRTCKITQITMKQGQYYFNWNLHSLSVYSCSCEDSRVTPLNLYYDISIAEDLHCLKAIDRNFVRNGLSTQTHSSLCSWAGVSEQITNNVLFWLSLSKVWAKQCLPCKWCFAVHQNRPSGNEKLLPPSLIPLRCRYNGLKALHTLWRQPY